MFEKFKQRSHRLEHIDTGDYTPEEYEDCIGELQLVNRWMGDAHSLKLTLLREVEQQSLRSFSVLDVGAGSGELLRVAATWARQTDRHLRAVGLELNERSAVSINEESTGFDEITSVRGNALSLPFADAQFDYVISSLFTHHFVDEQVVQILGEMSRVAKRRIFVIDLHRHPVAYLLYT
ncbi:MAG TPA: methyltransferase domain-containing protein, partial [Pyrinomonadaceae bacterium]|nr:methyltransferase domain-containing protein [Pyrinomonadaceae bacterium]